MSGRVPQSLNGLLSFHLFSARPIPESEIRSFARSHRPGTTIVECVVAAGVLMVAMGTVTTMAFRVSRVWMQTGHQRIAMDELSNQLERIIDAEPNKIDQMIDGIEPSEVAMTSLDEPELSATRVRDELGDRVTLQLQWRSPHPVAPVELTGWIDPSVSEEAP